VNNFSISDEMNNFPKSPDMSPTKKKVSSKDDHENEQKLEETLELEDDDVVFDEIRGNIAKLNQEINKKKEKTTHPYLKKDSGINRKKYQVNQ